MSDSNRPKGKILLNGKTVAEFTEVNFQKYNMTPAVDLSKHEIIEFVPSDQNYEISVARWTNVNPMPEEYTCFRCPINDTCARAWDAYNTNGDCLAEK